MNRFALASSAVALLAPLLCAQRPASGVPAPLPGVPMVEPPAPHPALGAQPWFNGGATTPAAAPAMPAGAGCPPAPPADPDTSGVKLEGKGLKKAVAKVAKLTWHESVLDARAMSAATGKPILLLQALGDIDGFA